MALCFKLIVKCKVFSFRNYGCIARHITSASDRSVLERSTLFIFNQKVQNFGRLNIFCDNIGVRVSSTSLWQENHATTARAFLAAKCDDEVAVSKELENIKKYFDWQVIHTEQGLSEITIKNCRSKETLLRKNVALVIEVPHSYNIFLKNASKIPVVVEKLENNKVEILSLGDCILSQLKSHSVKVNSESGNIVSRSSLIGDLELKTCGNGFINLRKIQGNKFEMSTEHGRVGVSSLYGTHVTISTSRGHVDIGDAHGEIEVKSQSGDICCKSLSGHLTATTEDGNINTKLTSNASIDALSLIDPNLACEFRLSSKKLHISNDLHLFKSSKEAKDDENIFIGRTHDRTCEHRVNVRCPKGKIDAFQENWFNWQEL
ncbi:uncharacterized protein LOC124453124 isoform X2 [Xenia sp. Carnegie-2017]|uniref:uncharacterized protein LOC124453124 isoform X2 n=1 Tax=Xenia sp. Carnegie-2017 TaxID=2897299 RepID=UPI001F037139|nr:uncharacterized protein LOC124453124 isoform X2 [Xenia sp. Carnegie-2017]